MILVGDRVLVTKSNHKWGMKLFPQVNLRGMKMSMNVNLRGTKFSLTKIRPKKIIGLFPAHRVTKKKFTRAAAKIFFLSEKMMFDAC